MLFLLRTFVLYLQWHVRGSLKHIHFKTYVRRIGIGVGMTTTLAVKDPVKDREECTILFWVIGEETPLRQSVPLYLDAINRKQWSFVNLLVLGLLTKDYSPPDKNNPQPLPTGTTIPRTIPHQDDCPRGPLPRNKTTHQDQYLCGGELSGYGIYFTWLRRENAAYEQAPRRPTTLSPLRRTG